MMAEISLLILRAKMVDNNKNSGVSSQLSEIDRAKRNLIDRKKEVDQQIAKLTAEVSGLEDRAPLAMLKDAIKRETESQQRTKNEIEKFAQQLRKLRQEKTQLSQERNETIEQIRSRQLEVALHKQTLRDSSASDQQKAAARSNISALEESEIPAYRSMHAEQSANISRVNTSIQGSLGEREHAERNLSMSRRDVRDFGSAQSTRSLADARREQLERKSSAISGGIAEQDARRRRRMIGEVDRMTPGSMLKEMQGDDATDPRMAGIAAGRSMRAQGGGIISQMQYSKAAQEFTTLFNAIKETKRSLAEMTEGTKEYIDKQKELNSLNNDAVKSATKMKELEGKAGNKWGMNVGGMVQGAAMMGSQAFGALGDTAAERYVLESQAQNEKIKLKSSYFKETSGIGTSALATLMSARGKGVGGKQGVYDETGNVSKEIKALGDDFGLVKQAMPAYQEAFRLLSTIPRITLDTVTGGIEGAKMNASTPHGAAFGAALGATQKLVGGIGGEGVNTMTNMIASPSMLRGAGAGEGGRRVIDWIDQSVGVVAKSLTKLGGHLEGSGVKINEYNSAVDKATTGFKEIITALPSVVARAADSVPFTTEILSAQQQQTEIARKKEIYSETIAPLVQSYMDAQKGVRGALRSRGMSIKERERESGEYDKWSQDEFMSDRGYGPAESLDIAGRAANTLGWSGRGGVNRSVAKTAMGIEALGFGSTSGTIAAAGAISRTGGVDPSGALEKTLKQAFIGGIRDSREFQGLLEAATSSAETSMTFSGSISNLLTFMGTGRPGEAKMAQDFEAMKGQEWSGKSKTMTDMVKFNLINSKAHEITSWAEKKGKKVSQNTRQELRQMQFMDPAELMDKELLSTMFQPETMGLMEDFNTANKRDITGEMATGVNSLKSTYGAMWVNQQDEYKDGTKYSDMAAAMNSGDNARISKMFAGKPEMVQWYLKKTKGGERTYTDPKTATTAAVAQSNILRNAGVWSGTTGGAGIPERPNRGGLPGLGGDNYDIAGTTDLFGQGAASNTVAELARVAEARRKREESGAGMLYNEEVKNLLGNKDASKIAVQSALDAAKLSSTTPVPRDKIKPIEDSIAEIAEGFSEMKKSFENFSVGKMVMSGGNVIIEGAGKISGAIVDGSISAVTKVVGQEIGAAISKSIGRDPVKSIQYDNSPENRLSPPGTPRGTPAPRGTSQ